MHSTEELRRQYEKAQEKAVQASLAANEAARRYTDSVIADRMAEFAKQGIVPGSKVVLVIEHWDGRTERKVAGFLGVEAGYEPGDVREKISKLKKDGTPSTAKSHIYYTRIEPFDATPTPSPIEEAERSGADTGTAEQPGSA